MTSLLHVTSPRRTDGLSEYFSGRIFLFIRFFYIYCISDNSLSFRIFSIELSPARDFHMLPWHNDMAHALTLIPSPPSCRPVLRSRRWSCRYIDDEAVVDNTVHSVSPSS